MKLPIAMEPLDGGLIPRMLAAQMEDNGHCAPLATHVFIRNAEVVGAAAICAPAITFWASSFRVSPRESIELVRRTQLEASRNHKKFLCLCQTDSPFYPLMARFGFKLLGTADVFEMDSISANAPI
jgi:hypothetical protein